MNVDYNLWIYRSGSSDRLMIEVGSFERLHSQATRIVGSTMLLDAEITLGGERLRYYWRSFDGVTWRDRVVQL